MLNKNSKGILFVVSAPAGTGKTTLVNRLKEESTRIVQSISYTTREMRKEEKNGVDYLFVSKDVFSGMVQNNEFLEYASHFGNFYGIASESVKNLLEQGKHVFLVIDTKGAISLQQLKVPAVYIFITPPSLDELKRRLKKRATEVGADIQTRLAKVSEEMESISLYDYHIENGDLEDAYQTLKAIVIAEKHRINK